MQPSVIVPRRTRTSLALAAGGAVLFMTGVALAVAGEALKLEHSRHLPGLAGWGLVLAILGVALGASAAVTILADPSARPPSGLYRPGPPLAHQPGPYAPDAYDDPPSDVGHPGFYQAGHREPDDRGAVARPVGPGWPQSGLAAHHPAGTGAWPAASPDDRRPAPPSAAWPASQLPASEWHAQDAGAPSPAVTGPAQQGPPAPAGQSPRHRYPEAAPAAPPPARPAPPGQRPPAGPWPDEPQRGRHQQTAPGPDGGWPTGEWLMGQQPVRRGPAARQSAADQPAGEWRTAPAAGGDWPTGEWLMGQAPVAPGPVAAGSAGPGPARPVAGWPGEQSPGGHPARYPGERLPRQAPPGDRPGPQEPQPEAWPYGPAPDYADEGWHVPGMTAADQWPPDTDRPGWR